MLEWFVDYILGFIDEFDLNGVSLCDKVIVMFIMLEKVQLFKGELIQWIMMEDCGNFQELFKIMVNEVKCCGMVVDFNLEVGDYQVMDGENIGVFNQVVYWMEKVCKYFVDVRFEI